MDDRQTDGKKSPYRWLWAILIQVVINVLLVPLGIWVDIKFWDASARAMIEAQGYVNGHGIPVFTLLLPLFGFVVTVIVTVAAIICTTVSVIREKNDNKDNSIDT